MAEEYLLQIEGIAGDSDVEGHEGWIDVSSWSWGASRATGAGGGGGGAGGGAGRPKLDDLRVVTAISSASPELVESCLTGRRHRSAVVVGRRTGGRSFEFLRYALADVTVIEVEHGDAEDDGGPPMEVIALDFRGLTLTFTAQRADGSPGRSTSVTHP